MAIFAVEWPIGFAIQSLHLGDWAGLVVFILVLFAITITDFKNKRHDADHQKSPDQTAWASDNPQNPQPRG